MAKYVRQSMADLYLQFDALLMQCYTELPQTHYKKLKSIEPMSMPGRLNKCTKAAEKFLKEKEKNRKEVTGLKEDSNMGIFDLLFGVQHAGRDFVRKTNQRLMDRPVTHGI